MLTNHFSGYLPSQLEIIRTIFAKKKMTRLDLVGALQTSHQTITAGVKKLLNDQILIEESFLSNERGRSSAVLSLNPEYLYFICFDIGALSTKIAVVRFDGSIISSSQILNPFPDDVHRQYITPQMLRNEISSLLIQFGRQRFLALCFAISGVVDFQNKRTVFCANIRGWDDVDFQKEFGDPFGLPVYLDSGGHCCALAENLFVFNNQVSNLLFISVGASVNTGIILNGQLLRGVCGAAGELGHIRVRPELEVPDYLRRCTCGHLDCMEQYVTYDMFPLLVRVLERAEHCAPDAPDRYPQEPSRYWIREAYEADNPRVRRVVEHAGRILGEEIAKLANILNPQQIILGGGTIFALPDMVRMVRECIQKDCLAIIAKSVTVDSTKLGCDGAFLGAALLAINDLLNL